MCVQLFGYLGHQDRLDGERLLMSLQAPHPGYLLEISTLQEYRVTRITVIGGNVQ